MSNYFLITTSLENTWETDKKIIFLGEWCKQPHKESSWKNLNFETQFYHWNDRDKLKYDYSYSKNLYNNLVEELSKGLNNYHNTNYSIRYWKIVLGLWLLSFIQLVLERYENIKQVTKNENKYETIILEIDKKILIPKDYEMYSRLIMSETWNHFIYSEILKNIKNPNKIILKKKEFKNQENFHEYLKERHYSKVREIYSFFTSFLKRKINHEKVLISESYLGFYDEIKLNLKLNCVPKYYNFKLPNEKIIDEKKRKNYLLNVFKQKNE